MALAATYQPTLSRIHLAGTFLSPAVYVVFDRTIDGIRYETVRGGTEVTVAGQNASIDDYEFPVGVEVTYRLRGYDASDGLLVTNTTTITQDIDDVWLKVPAAPFLNRAVTVSTAGDRTRAARGSVFDIVGRSDPVAVSDIRSSIAFDVRLRTFSAAEEEAIELLLSTGEIVFFHLPAAEQCMPGGYYFVGDIGWGPSGSRAKPGRLFTLPLRRVAKPGPHVVGSAYTWQSVVSEYATWTAVLADNATWADLLARTGTPSEVIVP